MKRSRVWRSGLCLVLAFGLFYCCEGAKRRGSVSNPGAAQTPGLVADWLPKVGETRLRALSPSVLELSLTTGALRPEPGTEPWKFLSAAGMKIPSPNQYRVLAGGREISVVRVGFRRRVTHAAIGNLDSLRVGNWIVLVLSSQLREGERVNVAGLEAELGPNRESDCIHVNRVEYLSEGPKLAFVGRYLGDLGELPISATSFELLDGHGQTVLRGDLRLRPDLGWNGGSSPYHVVKAADFSTISEPGEYRIRVPGLGCSAPFRIGREEPAMLARSLALGLYHQRCGESIRLPYTRFTHGPCHTAPAEPVNRERTPEAVEMVERTSKLKLSEFHFPSTTNAPRDVSGGHHDAGDYSKYIINSAQLVERLLIGVDCLGAAELDNLGIPESGDHISDLLEEAVKEVRFILKMQDADGGFYFLVYPRKRSYEWDVTPDKGDPQVLFPKNTAGTAAAVAALAKAACSQNLQRLDPDLAKRCLAAATSGWKFLLVAQQKYGDLGYQKITHYGDSFEDKDELVWAAAELYVATGEAQYAAYLQTHFSPGSSSTHVWSWVKMFEGYGAAARCLAFASPKGGLSTALLAACRAEAIAQGNDLLEYTNGSSYGVALPYPTKRFNSAGWFFPTDAAFDLMVAYKVSGDERYRSAALQNISYVFGANPNDVTFITGLPDSPLEVVSQYQRNAGRICPPSGLLVGAVQGGFGYFPPFGTDLKNLTYPPDADAAHSGYPPYDRWSDAFNVSTEMTIVNQGAGLAAAAMLMAEFPPADLSNTAAWFSIWEYDGTHLVRRYGQKDPRETSRRWNESELLWLDGKRRFSKCVASLGK